MTINPEQKFQQIPNLEAHEAEDGLIVFNSTTDKVHHLNPTAGVLFELCSAPSSAAALAEELGALYELAEPPTEAVNTTLDPRIAESTADGR